MRLTGVCGPRSARMGDSRTEEQETYVTKFLLPCIWDYFNNHFADSLLRR